MSVQLEITVDWWGSQSYRGRCPVCGASNRRGGEKVSIDGGVTWQHIECPPDPYMEAEFGSCSICGITLPTSRICGECDDSAPTMAALVHEERAK